MKTLLPLAEAVLTALPHSLLLILAVLVGIRCLISEGLRKILGRPLGNTVVFRSEILKTFLESIIALYGAWYLGAVVVRDIGIVFDLMHDSSLVRFDLWLFVVAVLGTFLLLVHGVVSVAECLFLPAMKFVDDVRHGTVQRPFVHALEATAHYLQPFADFATSATRILVLAAWHALSHRFGRRI